MSHRNGKRKSDAIDLTASDARIELQVRAFIKAQNGDITMLSLTAR